MLDRDSILDCLRELVSINSINPALVPDAPGEGEVAAYVERWMLQAGLEVALHEPVAGRISVVGRLAGTGGGRSLMLNAHYDTVGVVGMEAPFSAELRDGRVYGRGAFDMKGSLAACMGAVGALAASGRPLAGDVLLAAVADEEDASLGTAEVITHYRPDAAIVTEPTGLDVCLAHKGFAWLEVTTVGVAAHGSRPELGVDANLRMGRVLHALNALERDLRLRPPHPLLGTASLHAALLAGGSGPSTYADTCRLVVERRTLPGEPPERPAGEIESILARLRSLDPSFIGDCRLLLQREPFEVARGAPIVRTVAEALTEVTGTEPRFIGDSPWMDSALLAAVGIETVVVGPSGAGAHAVEEWVDVESVYTLADVLVASALAYCG